MEQCNIDRFGICCCQCRNQVKIFCHPQNKLGNGQISTIMGYGCPAIFYEDGVMDSLIFFDTAHGCCELFLNKN